MTPKPRSNPCSVLAYLPLMFARLLALAFYRELRPPLLLTSEDVGENGARGAGHIYNRSKHDAQPPLQKQVVLLCRYGKGVINLGSDHAHRA